jgi:hypothetical protein
VFLDVISVHKERKPAAAMALIERVASYAPQLLRKASRSALIVSAWVVGMPWGKSL